MITGPDGTDERSPHDPIARAKAVGYSLSEIASVPPEVVLGLGCGNPVALATLAEGEVVLDLGCGGGFDCLLAAKRVGPTGQVLGVDSSEEALEVARAAALRQGAGNVEFRLGWIEDLPVENDSVDVVISNCVISDVPDKEAAFREVARVLRPGGRALISDLTLSNVPPGDLSVLPAVWVNWLAHAAGREEYLKLMRRAGLRDVRIVGGNPYSAPGTPSELLGRIASILVRAVR